MIDDVLAYPHQIGDALWRIDAAAIPSLSLAGGLIVCGAAAGDLAALALGDRAVARVRDGLEPSAGFDTFVLCASYSGDDPDALRCFEEAGHRGCARAVVCTSGALAAQARVEGVPVIGVPGGMPSPDLAIVYFLLAALECAAAAGAGPSLRAEAEAAVPALEALAADDSPARQLADRLRGRTAVIEGEPALAHRWESRLRPYASDGPPERVDLTAEAEAAASPTERVMRLVMLGDLAAQHLAAGTPQPPQP